MPVLGNLRTIGAIAVDYRNPSLSWTSSPTNHGVRSCSISGTIEMAKGHQLAELVNNPAAQTTVGPATGVLEWVAMDGDALVSLTGYYLLESFDLDIEHQYVFADRVGFTLKATYLGDVT